MNRDEVLAILNKPETIYSATPLARSLRAALDELETRPEVTRLDAAAWARVRQHLTRAVERPDLLFERAYAATPLSRTKRAALDAQMAGLHISGTVVNYTVLADAVKFVIEVPAAPCYPTRVGR